MRGVKSSKSKRYQIRPKIITVNLDVAQQAVTITSPSFIRRFSRYHQRQTKVVVLRIENKSYICTLMENINIAEISAIKQY